MTITQIEQLRAIYEEREQLKLDLTVSFELFQRNCLQFEVRAGIPPMHSAIEFLQATAMLFGGTYDEYDQSVEIPLNHGIYTLITETQLYTPVTKTQAPSGKIIFEVSPQVRLYENTPTAITEEDIYQMNEETRLERSVRGIKERIGEIPTEA